MNDLLRSLSWSDLWLWVSFLVRHHGLQPDQPLGLDECSDGVVSGRVWVSTAGWWLYGSLEWNRLVKLAIHSTTCVMRYFSQSDNHSYNYCTLIGALQWERRDSPYDDTLCSKLSCRMHFCESIKYCTLLQKSFSNLIRGRKWVHFSKWMVNMLFEVICCIFK